MGDLRIKDMPDDLNERVRRMVAEKNCTIHSAVITALEREVERWEWLQRLAKRPKTKLTVNAAETVKEQRRLREIELDCRNSS